MPACWIRVVIVASFVIPTSAASGVPVSERKGMMVRSEIGVGRLEGGSRVAGGRGQRCERIQREEVALAEGRMGQVLETVDQSAAPGTRPAMQALRPVDEAE